METKNQRILTDESICQRISSSHVSVFCETFTTCNQNLSHCLSHFSWSVDFCQTAILLLFPTGLRRQFVKKIVKLEWTYHCFFCLVLVVYAEGFLRFCYPAAPARLGNKGFKEVLVPGNAGNLAFYEVF